MFNLNQAVGLYLQLTAQRPHEERGLSQSTENAILLAGAASIATLIILAIRAYVTDQLPRT